MKPGKDGLCASARGPRGPGSRTQQGQQTRQRRRQQMFNPRKNFLSIAAEGALSVETSQELGEGLVLGFGLKNRVTWVGFPFPPSLRLWRSVLGLSPTCGIWEEAVPTPDGPEIKSNICIDIEFQSDCMKPGFV